MSINPNVMDIFFPLTFMCSLSQVTWRLTQTCSNYYGCQ